MKTPIDAICQIVLFPEANETEFVKVMKTEVFPGTQIRLRNVAGQQHILLKSKDKTNERRRYLWLIILDLVGGGTGYFSAKESLSPVLEKKIKKYGEIFVFKSVAVG